MPQEETKPTEQRGKTPSERLAKIDILECPECADKLEVINKTVFCHKCKMVKRYV
jgi:hypothetical protein